MKIIMRFMNKFQNPEIPKSQNVFDIVAEK